MFGRGCHYNHQALKPAGIYKRDKYGQFIIKNGEKVLVTEEDTWVCPYCRLLFLKPNRKYRREINKKEEKKYVKHNRTVSKVLR